MRKMLIAFVLSLVLLPASMPAFCDEYDPEGPLRVKRVLFSEDKPRGPGMFTLREGCDFGADGDAAYIYVELANCRAEREKALYHIRLALDVDIYYEDGLRIFSGEEVNTFDYPSPTKRSDAYIWARIDTAHLTEGEYKVEMTVTDEISEKEAFALARFRRVGAPD